MVEPLMAAVTIAQLLGIGLDLVKRGHEIHKQVTPTNKRADGYVYVVQEVDYSNKFMIDSAIGNVDWLTHLSAKIPGGLEAVLVIPTDDTRGLERELHILCGTNRNVGDWFDLTPLQVTELRQLQVVVDLAAGNLVGPRKELETDDLEQAKRLFELLSNASGGTRLHQEINSTGDPSADLDLKSVPTINYRNLPKLKRRSGYLLVVRDAGSRNHKIESTQYPADYINKTLGLVSLHYGLELVLALESSRIVEVENALSILYPSNDANGWTQLSPTQLQEIRNLATPGLVQSSIYLTPKTHWGLETVQTYDYKELPRLRNPAGYVCVTQGVKPGKKYKIWHTTKPKELAEDLRLALMLNNPHDATTSSEPIKFGCVIKAEHATSFQDFLHRRYSESRQSGDWYDLDDAQLKEISNMPIHQ